MEKRELICIGCPMGCPLTVELENGEIKTITGYTCKKGETYARKEVTNPTRIVTSTVGWKADGLTWYLSRPGKIYPRIRYSSV